MGWWWTANSRVWEGGFAREDLLDVHTFEILPKSPASWKWWVPTHLWQECVLSFPTHLWTLIFRAVTWLNCKRTAYCLRNLTTERSNQTDTHGFVNYPPWKRTWHFEDHPFLIGDTSSNIYLLFHCHLSFAGVCTLHWNRNRSPGNRARLSRIVLSFVVCKQMARWNW